MQRVKHNFDGYIRIFSFPITPSFQLTFRIASIHLLNYFQLTFSRSNELHVILRVAYLPGTCFCKLRRFKSYPSKTFAK